MRKLGIQSMAVPPLGCGLGGLHWPDVRERICRELELLDDIQIFVFKPAEAPHARQPGGPQ